MIAIIILIFLFAESFGDTSDFNSKLSSFSVKLLHHTLENSNRDVMLSPYGLWSLLIAMTYATSGATRENFLNVLSLPERRSEAEEEYQILKASLLDTKGVNDFFMENFLFYDENSNVYPSVIEEIENGFDFTTKRLNFEDPNQAYRAALEVYENEHGDGFQVVKPEDFVNSTMLMCNYIAFKAKWSKSIQTENVETSIRRGNDIVSSYHILIRGRLRYSSLDSQQFSVTEIPFEGENYCMLILRPLVGRDVKQILRSLRNLSLKGILDKLQSDSDLFGLRDVELKLPVEGYSSVLLNEPLFNMGLTEAFNSSYSGFNFTDEQNYINEIALTVWLDVSTERILLYTTTASEHDQSLAKDSDIPIRQVVKDPFIFLIVEKSTATILLGGSFTISMLGHMGS